MQHLYLGIMTGTSLDAIDVAACRFEGKRVQLVAFHSTRWPDDLRSLLFELATSEYVRMDDVAHAHFRLAKEYDRAVRETLEVAKIRSGDVRGIGLHGQTVRHLPKDGATLQLGSGAALAAVSGIDVVSDFRAADVALGGEGAPLMPMFDYAFLRNETSDRATLNIGGIANITWLPKNASIDDVVAFDTGPGNMLIDLLAQRCFGQPYDTDGAHARRGNILEENLKEMLSHPYFAQDPPKTTGRELFGERFIAATLDAIANGTLKAEDAIATMTEFTAKSIADALSKLSRSKFELIVSGGGAHNSFLMQRLAFHLQNASIVTSDALGIPANAKEAIAFAYFAKAFVEEIPIHLPKTTGASARVILGSLSCATRF
jgi:anhydro-N-acetylmuramic acid kinase